RIREDDVWRLAAEFERDALEIAGGSLEDELADLGGAGEGDLVDVGMLGDGAAGAGAEAGDYLDDALGQSGLEDELAEAERGERSLFGGFEDYNVAAGQGGRDLPRGHQKREVPRDDLSADADRLAQREVEHPGVGRIGITVDLGGPSGVVAEGLGRAGDIDVLRFEDRLAVVEGLEFGEFLGVFFDELGDLEQVAG